MTMAYSNRESSLHIDGTPIFQNKQDRDNESAVAELVEQAWGVQLHSMGMLAPLDWYATLNGRPAGYAELKSRSHRHDKFDTVFLNMRKWMWMWRYAEAACVPALFIVRFVDTVRWIPVISDGPWKVNPSHNRMAGCRERVKSDTDVEWVIDVPIADMKPLVEGA